MMKRDNLKSTSRRRKSVLAAALYRTLRSANQCPTHAARNHLGHSRGNAFAMLGGGSGRERKWALERAAPGEGGAEGRP